MRALQSLRARLAELADLSALGMLAAWDQRAMMPPGGAAGRARQMATLQRLAHDRGTADEVGGWLEELEGRAGELDDLDRDIVRIARRDWDRARRVPGELASELAQAAAEGQAVWQAARAESDFAAFVPALRRNVELAREYAACLDGGGSPYDALLGDYDFGLTAQRIREIFGRLATELPPIVARAADVRRTDPVGLSIPVEVQQAMVRGVLARVGVDDEGWRLDTAAHPFSASIGPQDTRLTTRYEDGRLESVVAALHEFGHGLYERQIAPELARTNLGHGTSMSVHESQSKLWENHVGRHPAFTAVLVDELERAGMVCDPEVLRAALVDVRPSLIRVAADPVTYPLHIVLRFELEVALVEGTLDIADLPAAWQDRLQRLLGVEAPDDASGVLQDVHWGSGAFGYFPSYAMGAIIAAQLWEQLESDLGPQDDALAVGEVTAVRHWLGEHVHRHGRRLDTEPLVEQATGRGLDVEPFLRHVRTLV
ncbi:carboxypeptidase M32 [Baekduia soli]|uniref:Metal-dependent carboxypeptidase n=1 Tax=Baekduia soli TaxID=496014 RepID=A0A5B8U797_9ACTN|nr:carboxypeptidase M32 [Baekduia soli]QEC48698.1 carboxypeptidase M32 [Baekduia soli]